jgi:hypothetical protein
MLFARGLRAALGVTIMNRFVPGLLVLEALVCFAVPWSAEAEAAYVAHLKAQLPD